MKKCKVKNVIFTIPEEWSEEDVVKCWNKQSQGEIIVCPVCKRVDIDILTHFEKCNIEIEEQRKLSFEYYD